MKFRIPYLVLIAMTLPFCSGAQTVSTSWYCLPNGYCSASSVTSVKAVRASHSSGSSAHQAAASCVDGDKRGIDENGVDESHSSVPLKCVGGKWVLDKEEQDRITKEQAEWVRQYEAEKQHQKDLWDALRTRVLTDVEMTEVLKYGSQIEHADPGAMILTYNLRPIASNPSSEDETLFLKALYYQFLMRDAQRRQETPNLKGFDFSLPD